MPPGFVRVPTDGNPPAQNPPICHETQGIEARSIGQGSRDALTGAASRTRVSGMRAMRGRAGAKPDNRPTKLKGLLRVGCARGAAGCCSFAVGSKRGSREPALACLLWGGNLPQDASRSGVSN